MGSCRVRVVVGGLHICCGPVVAGDASHSSGWAGYWAWDFHDLGLGGHATHDDGGFDGDGDGDSDGGGDGGSDDGSSGDDNVDNDDSYGCRM